MKIGLVLPSIPAYSETFFINKIKGLEAQGHEVILFVNKSKKETYLLSKIVVSPKLTGSFAQVGVVSAFNLLKSIVFNFKKSRKLYVLDRKDGLAFAQCFKNIIGNSHILSESIDWLHFGFGTMVFGRENVAKAIGAKMAVSFRGFDIGVYPLKYPGCYDKLWKKVDKIHVISNDIRDLLYKQGFDDQSPLVKITPAIDTTLFKNEKVQPLSTRYNFITIARLHWKKGIESTLEALSILKKEGVNFQYTIVGEGGDYERLKFAAYQLDISEHVTFMGKIAHEKIRDELNKADIYIQYSIQEGFCNAVLEAQALGLLCIVSDAEGLAENIVNKETGWVVPRWDAQLLSNKIKEVLSVSSLEKQQISRNAKDRVKCHFTIERQQQEFVEFYKE